MPSARRRLLGLPLCGGLLAALGAQVSGAQADGRAEDTHRRWVDRAAAMRRQAMGWGDQPYGAVLVLDGRLVGEGPSRVVIDRDPDAHAERVALRDARRRLGRDRLDGAVLYSTSRPCPMCEAAAAEVGVARMIHGEALHDAGAPRR